MPYRESGALELIHDIESMVISPDGKLYFTDGGDHRIKTFSFTTRSVGIVAGNGNIGPAQPGAFATSSFLRYPDSLAVASDGTVYFAGLEPSVFSISPEDGKLREISLHASGDQRPVNEYDNPHSIVLDQKRQPLCRARQSLAHSACPAQDRNRFGLCGNLESRIQTRWRSRRPNVTDALDQTCSRARG